MPNRTLVRALWSVGLLAAGWGAWQLGYGLMVGRLAMPEAPAAEPLTAPTGLGRIFARVERSPGQPVPIPTSARLRPAAANPSLPARVTPVGERGLLELDLVVPGRYVLDLVAFPTSGPWEVTVEAGKTTDLGVLLLPGS